MYKDHKACCSECQRQDKVAKLAGLASIILGLPEPKTLPATKGASSYSDKLSELGQIIKGTTRPIPEYERERQYRLSEWRPTPRTKGASALAARYDRVNRIEREVKLEMLGKMVRQ
jgi:hypothetical protein